MPLEGRAKSKSKTIFDSQVSLFVCLKKKIRLLSLVIFLAMVLAGFYFWFTSVLVFNLSGFQISFCLFNFSFGVGKSFG